MLSHESFRPEAQFERKRNRAVQKITFPYISDKNLPYVAPDASGFVDPQQMLDVYVPAIETPANGFPIILFLHGGKLTHGDKSNELHVAKAFAKNGYLTVVANYRLSPNVSHPKHVEDAASALQWIHTNIHQYDGNVNDVTLFGFSTGAYLVSLLLADAETYIPSHLTGNKLARRAVCLSGFYRVDKVAPGRDSSVWGSSPALWRAASPFYKYEDMSEEQRFCTRLLPCLFVYGDGDEPSRKAENLDMYRLLNAFPESDIEVHEIADRDHVGLWREMQASGDAVVQTIVAWLDCHRAN